MDRAVLNIIIQARDEASSVIKSVGSSFDRVQKNSEDFLKGVVGVGAALTGVATVSVMTAARTETLGVAMNAVAKATGTSTSVLKEQEAILKKQGITTQESNTILTRFMQSQLDVTKATDLARVAQDLAVISGTNSSETASGLTEAIATQNTMLLRSYGIVRSSSDVFKEYAESIGKSSNELTEAEKKTAVLNLILSEGKKVAGAYDAAMGTAGKKLSSMARLTEEARNAIGNEFLPVFGQLIDQASLFLKMITPENIKKFKDELKNMTPVLVGVAGAITGAVIPAIVGMGLAFAKMMIPLLPFMAIGAAVALVIYAIYQAFVHWEQIKQIVVDVFTVIKDAISMKLDEILTAVKTYFMGIYTSIVNTLTEIQTSISIIFTSIFDTLFYILTQILTFITFILGMIWAGIQFVFWSIYGFIESIFLSIWGVIGNTMTSIYTSIVSYLTMAWDFIISVFNSIRNFIQTVWSSISSFINEKLGQINSSFNSQFNNVKNTIVSIFTSVYDWFVGKLNSLWNKVTDITGKIKDAFKTMADGIMAALRSIKFPHLSIGTGTATVAGREIQYPKLSVDWYEKGGWVDSTGLAVVHEGEFVLSRDMLQGNTPIPGNIVNNNQPINIYATVNSDMDISSMGYQLAWILRNSR